MTQVKHLQKRTTTFFRPTLFICAHIQTKKSTTTQAHSHRHSDTRVHVHAHARTFT